MDSNGQEIRLDEMRIGSIGKIVKIGEHLRSRQKFADVGMVEGAKVKLEGRSPFGGLIRVKVMGASMSFHVLEAKEFTMRVEE